MHMHASDQALLLNSSANKPCTHAFIIALDIFEEKHGGKCV